MLLNVLIIDDEPLVRGYIRSLLDWESCGFVICGEAVDGGEALDRMAHMQPDIVLLDIHMPGMDGVALSSRIAEKYASTKIIVLSSYDNYDYVRDTLQNGVVDYLLKHRIDGALMLQTLQKARDKILEEARKAELDKRLAREREFVSPTLVETYLKELVLGNKERFDLMEEYFRSLKLFTGKSAMMIGVLQISYFDLITYRYKDSEKNGLVKHVMDICRQTLQNDEGSYMAYIEQGRFALLFVFDGVKSEGALWQQVYNRRSRMESSLRLFLNLRADFGFGGVCNRLNEADRFYQEACRNMEHKEAGPLPKEHGAPYEKGSSPVTALTISQEKQLLTAMETGNGGLAELVINEIFDMLKQESPSSRGVQVIVKEMLDIAFKAGRKADIQLDWTGAKQDLSRRAGHETLEDIKARIQSLYSTLMDEMRRNQQQESYSKYVRQALDYISRHYREDISLEKAAKDIGITHTYLSRLFKVETGVSFTERLNHVRIEVSKKFMDGGESVKELYENVGFKNYSYFFKVFKEITGSTPLEYMKNKQNR